MKAKRKKKKNEKFVLLYTLFRTFLFFLLSSRQVDRMDDDDDDDEGEKKENRTRPVYIYACSKSNLKWFLFFSHRRLTENESAKTERDMSSVVRE
jgi:hypothetical protein